MSTPCRWDSFQAIEKSCRQPDDEDEDEDDHEIDYRPNLVELANESCRIHRKKSFDYQEGEEEQIDAGGLRDVVRGCYLSCGDDHGGECVIHGAGASDLT
jgi:hypothetical protein